MTIQTEQARRFLTTAAIIKPNILYPALDSILIRQTAETVTFTKSNNNIFCVDGYSAPSCPTEAFLIPEKLLAGFLLDLTAETFDVQSDGATTTLKAGKKVNKCAWQNPTTFPIMPQPTTGAVHILPHTITQIKTASRYLSNNKNVTASNFVGLSANGVFASDGSFVYYNKSELPDLFLGEDATAIVQQLGECTISESDNYIFFSTPDVTFAHVKHVVQPINYAPILAIPGEDYFIVQKADLENYCRWVGYTAKVEYPVAILSGDATTLQLQYSDSNFGLEANTTVPITANALVQPFKFSAPNLLNALTALPYKELNFVRIGPHYKLLTPEDENYIGIIAGQH